MRFNVQIIYNGPQTLTEVTFTIRDWVPCAKHLVFSIIQAQESYFWCLNG